MRKPKQRHEIPVPDGLVRIVLLKKWGEREPGTPADVDPTRAEQMVDAKKAKYWTEEEAAAPEPEVVPDGG